jgi:lipopolysaccharide export system protein LptA
MLVVVAAVLLLGALGIFLTAAKWKNRIIGHDLPHHLPKEIQQEANGFSFTHAYGAHLQYKIHASKEIQLRDNRVMLHGVQIELFGEDGTRVDEIAGDAFEYDKKSGLAIAVGPVEMVLTQPANSATKSGKGDAPAVKSTAPLKQIHVKTSSVTFDQDTGMVTTMQRVDFDMTQGNGSSMGATYDSQNGHLTLDHAVELTTTRGTGTVKIDAQHAEFDRSAQTCWMRAAETRYRNAKADAAQAEIVFRQDGSAETLNASNGFTLTTATGGRLAAPTATMDFDEHSQPRHGHLEGGVVMDSVKEDRTVHGTSPVADLEFVGQGELRHAHLERGVVFTEKQGSGIGEQGSERPTTDEGNALSLSRTWRSPVADVYFRNTGKGQVEPASLHGAGGVVITSESRRDNGGFVPAKMSADEVTGSFDADSTLRSLTGTGHAGIEQTAANGTKQTANGDRLVADLAPAPAAQNRDQGSGSREQKDKERGSKRQETGVRGQRSGKLGAADQVESAELDGHVLLFERPAAKSGRAQAPLRATAGKAVYEGAGEWLHLTMSPRVTNGEMEMTADKVDVSQQSGDAFAHGNVKATWSGGAPGNKAGDAQGRQTAAGAGQDSAAENGAGRGGTAFGGSGPAHVIANEAQMNESTGEATFRGAARLWQQANSVTAPVIVLNQHAQTLEARTNDAATPVRAVLLSAGGTAMGAIGGKLAPPSSDNAATGKTSEPSVIRVRGGDLWYSDAEHRAVMHAGVLGAVVAETGTGTTSSDQLDLRTMPAGATGGGAQVDRMTASGHVALTAQGRRGTGEQLVYSGTTGDYVLTGTAAAPPRMNDPTQGSVTGEALIFHSRDDSVSIEGGGRETITRTTAPEAHGK